MPLLALQKIYKTEINAKRDAYNKMDPDAQAKAQATHQALHYAQDYDRAAAMIPHDKVFPDMLHMYTNEWNDIGHEGVHRHLVEPHTDKEICALQDTARTKVNEILRSPGLNLYVQYGLADVRHAMNGPGLLKLMNAPEKLMGIIDAMVPLYELMEEKGELKVETELKAEKAEAAAAARAAAAQEGKGKGKGGKAAPARKPAAPKTRVLSFDEIMSGGLETAGSPLPAAAPKGKAPSAAPADGAQQPASAGVGKQSAPTYTQRVCAMVLTFMTHYGFTHMHNALDTDKLDPATRKRLAEQAAHLGVACTRAKVACIGTGKRSTYSHDIVYGPPMLYMVLGKPYLAATEGNEHAHQEVKKWFKKMTCHSDKSTCDMLQYLNLSCIKHLLVEQDGDIMPHTKEMQRRLGKKTASQDDSEPPACKKCKQDGSKEAMRERVNEEDREKPGYAVIAPLVLE